MQKISLLAQSYQELTWRGGGGWVGGNGEEGGEGVGGRGEQSLPPICLTSMKKPIQNRVKTFSIRKVAFYCWKKSQVKLG